NRALSPVEIAAIYAAGSDGKCRISSACPSRWLSIAGVTEVSGRQTALSVSMTGVGIENSVSFSLGFDPTLLSYQGQTPGAGALGTSMLVNTNRLVQGQLGLALAQPAGQSFAAGSNQLVCVRFLLS